MQLSINNQPGGIINFINGNPVTIHQSNGQQTVDVHSSSSPASDNRLKDDFSSNCSDCQSESRPQRGPRTQYLFSDVRGNEDTQRAATQADRVRHYIADHKMGQYQLDSKTSSKLNLMVACFWYRWYELDMVDEEPHPLLRGIDRRQDPYEGPEQDLRGPGSVPRSEGPAGWLQDHAVVPLEARR